MNRLAKESSPYLQQHKNNPVDWFPWNEAAFAKAKAENKPILVSIGYSTCHWCHVMEAESFEEEATAKLMNEHFVNIKVDREERPDIDAIYMEAVQIMTGSGGWPLNCFLLPDGRPFFGGTYFPIVKSYNRPSWKEVLQNIANTYKVRYAEVVEQAEKLTAYVNEAEEKIFESNLVDLAAAKQINQSFLDTIFNSFQERFDREDGGFGAAPKFPSTMSLRFCLDYYHFTNNEKALEQVVLSLDKMIRGGIYDQIGGGFARYATDKKWLIPHFEKMLYDNALLVDLLCDVYKVTKNILYKETIIETLDFIEREMLLPEGGFYSAQDADSEGVEGKYYVWERSEIENILGKEADLFCRFYDVSASGNWENVNILNRKSSFEAFAKVNDLELDSFKLSMKKARFELLKIRNKRVKPSLDDKVLLDWNVLMTMAFANAYTALGEEKYLKIAEANLDFINKKMKNEQHYFHTYKDGVRKQAAFLDDNALLIEAFLKLFTIRQKEEYLERAAALTDFVRKEFLDEKTNLFYFTSEKQTDLILRKKELYDNASPSGNSTMVHNLLKLSILIGKESYKNLAIKMLEKMQPSVEKHPSSFAKWATAMQFLVYPLSEIAIIGEAATKLTKELQQHYIPNFVLMATETENKSYPLLIGKMAGKETLIFVCQNYACQLPVKSIEMVLKKVN